MTPYLSAILFIFHATHCRVFKGADLSTSDVLDIVEKSEPAEMREAQENSPLSTQMAEITKEIQHQKEESAEKFKELNQEIKRKQEDWDAKFHIKKDASSNGASQPPIYDDPISFLQNKEMNNNIMSIEDNTKQMEDTVNKEEEEFKKQENIFDERMKAIQLSMHNLKNEMMLQNEKTHPLSLLQESIDKEHVSSEELARLKGRRHFRKKRHNVDYDKINLRTDEFKKYLSNLFKTDEDEANHQIQKMDEELKKNQRNFNKLKATSNKMLNAISHKDAQRLSDEEENAESE